MLKPSTTTDPVTEAASSEGAARSTTPAALAIRKARRLSRGASEGEAALNAAREILPMIADHPRALELQLVAARMFEKSRIRDEARAVWRGVHDRWPEAEEPFRMLLRWTVRDQGVAAARAELDARYPKMPQDSVSEQLAYARCLTEVRAHGEAATVYQMVLNREPCHEEALTNFVKFATSRGEPWVAYDALQRAGQHGPLPRALERKRQEHALNASWLVEELQSDLHAQGAAPNPCEGRRDLVLASSTGSALRAAAIRKAVMSSDVLRRPFERRRRALGPIVMINSSLATGGAERQFVRVARHLHKAAKDERVIGSTTVSGDVEVWCRSLVSRPDAGFFAADLREAGVPVREIRNFVEDKNPALAAPLSSIAAYEQWLPRDMVWGLQRMSRKLLVKAPEVVSIWQDGMIGVSALAALMAGVPRIVLNFRGMPPSQRLHLLKPEYEPLYTALLNAPNVAFTANSEASARAYAEWLNVDEGRFHVIYNGVDTPSATGSQSDTIRWAEFEMRTGVDGAETLGAVMRFDENKRPFEWLEIAARVLARRPQARFVLVGAGPLWNEAQERAKALGIDHRCLFVGATPNVGFWLSRCDAKLLLSRSEGLPNALIEAQSLAVPVVTTPAGGAPEALRHGQTGYLLSSAETLDQDEAVEIVSSLLADETRRGALGKAGQQFARQRFSTEQMVKSVLETFSGVEYGNETLCASPSPEQIARPMAQLQQLDRMAMGYARNRSLSRYAQGAVNEVRNSQAMQMGQTAFRVASKPLRWPFVWFYLIMCRLKSKPKTQGVIGAEASVFRVDRAIATAKRAAACHGPEAAYMWAVANISSPRALGRCVATIALQCRDTHPELAAALALRVKSLAPGERLLAQLSDILREQGRMSEAERLHPRRQLRLLAPSVVAAQSVAAE